MNLADELAEDSGAEWDMTGTLISLSGVSHCFTIVKSLLNPLAPRKEEEVEQNFGSLRDLEEALAELAEQNEQLEEDCRDLEAWLSSFHAHHFFIAKTLRFSKCSTFVMSSHLPPPSVHPVTTRIHQNRTMLCRIKHSTLMNISSNLVKLAATRISIPPSFPIIPPSPLI